jgi:hypothetical protein
MMRLFAIVTALLLPALSLASSINWGSEFNSVNVQSDGVVRENAFAMPLTSGFNLVGGGGPMDESYASRGMTLDSIFGGSSFLGDIRKADQTLFWLGDTHPGHVCYTTRYLLEAGAPWQRWGSAEDNFVTSLDDVDVFLATRAAAALPGHVV